MIEIKCGSGGHYWRVDGKAFPRTTHYITYDKLLELCHLGHEFKEVVEFNGSSIFNDWFDREISK